MKKVILTGVALMGFAAASFAQGNTATLNQVGSSQSSTQNQTGSYLNSIVTQGNSSVGANTGNKSFTDQRENHNTTTVSQNSSQYNQAAVYQNNFSTKAANGAQNEATIEQIGSGGGALFAGDPNVTPMAGGSGTGNVARIGQEQSGNKAAIQQNGYGGSNNSNYGRIDQSGANNGSTGDVYIHQNGQSYGNVASINESGNTNKATVSQSGNSFNNTASVDQSSNTNSAAIDQSTTSYRNKATVTQHTIASRPFATGDGNDGTINQTDNSHDNTATIDQASTGAKATINQRYESADNTATIKQAGAGTNQLGQTIATIDQTYAYNTGAGGNTATIEQNLGGVSAGSGNTAHIKQGSSGAGIASGNVAGIYQEYSLNQARLEQLGTRNDGMIHQTGDYNVVQNGAGASGSFALQNGDQNKLTVNQNSGGMPPYAANTANVTQVGNSNMGTINQMGIAPAMP